MTRRDKHFKRAFETWLIGLDAYKSLSDAELNEFDELLEQCFGVDND